MSRNPSAYVWAARNKVPAGHCYGCGTFVHQQDRCNARDGRLFHVGCVVRWWPRKIFTASSQPRGNDAAYPPGLGNVARGAFF